MKQSQKNYDELHKIGRQIKTLKGISHLLEWDQETYMPPGAALSRASQLEMLSGMIHELNTGKKFSNALSKLINIQENTIIAKDLLDAQKSALREWRYDYVKAKALPKSFVEEFTKTTSQSILVWREAKKSNTFAHFAPYLDKLVTMSRKKADLLGYKDDPYDALLNEYEPNISTAEVTSVFTKLRTSIVDLLKKKQKKPIDDHFLHGNFNQDKQLEFCRLLLKQMGFSEEYGRLDLSTHPFSSSSHPSDNRITTRFHPTSLLDCISATLHEGGHALYEMGLPKEHFGSPLGEAISLGIHESQSRFWETRIGQSKAFWQYNLPLLKKHFPKKFDDVTLEEFYKAINKVQPGFIRIEADEITYSLHVILRFELEKQLIAGTLKIRDVPEAWNAKMQELLNITPKNDAEGCLQDIHWSMGAFGYFPTYTLGNLYAACFFETFAKEHPDWEDRVAKGNLSFIKEWLGNAIHKHGRQYSGQELLKKITGKKLHPEAFVNYLNSKY